MIIKSFNYKFVNSTNDIAINLIKQKNIKAGFVLAEKQKKGRGQRGKKWISYKGNLFISVIEESMYFLAIIGLISTVVSAFYYLRIIKIIYFDPPKEKFDQVNYFGLKISLAISTLLILLYFIYPSGLINLVSKINII